MPSRGKHVVNRVLGRMPVWTNLYETSAIIKPFDILGAELDRLDRVINAEVNLASLRKTPPYAMRGWYRSRFSVPISEVINTEPTLMDANKSRYITPVSTLLDFRLAPPTYYDTDSTFSSWDFAEIAGRVVLDIRYVHELKRSEDAVAQDALVLLLKETADLDASFQIYFVDYTTANVPITESIQSYRTTGRDERITTGEDTFSYTVNGSPNVYQDIFLIDLMNSTTDILIQQRVANIETADTYETFVITGAFTPMDIVYEETSEDHVIGTYPNATSGWTKNGFQDYWDDGAAGAAPYVNPPTGLMHMKFHCNVFANPCYSPGIELIGGMTYTFSFKGKGETANRFRVGLQETPTYASWDSNTSFNLSTTYASYSMEITPPVTATYYVAIDGYSSVANTQKAFMDDIKVELTDTVEIPISLYDTSMDGFTFATTLRPGSGRDASGHCYVDTSGYLNTVFDTVTLTTALPASLEFYRVVVTYDNVTVKLYVNGVLRASEDAVLAAISVVPVKKWGGDNGAVGPTEYWTLPWTGNEIAFDTAHAGTSVAYAPGSLLVEASNLLARYTLQEGAGDIVHDSTQVNDIDLSLFTGYTWEASTEIPAVTVNNFVRSAYGLRAYTSSVLADTITNSMTIEGGWTGGDNGDTVVELYNTTESLSVKLALGADTATLSYTGLTSVVVSSLTFDVNTDHHFRIIIKSDEISLQVDDGAAVTQAGAPVAGPFDLSIAWGSDQALAQTFTGYLTLLAIAPGHVATAALVEAPTARPVDRFTQQWVNDVYQDVLFNLTDSPYHLAVSNVASYQYIHIFQQADHTYQSATGIPGRIHHYPYMQDGELTQVLSPNGLALEYTKAKATAGGFNITPYFHGNKQRAGLNFESSPALFPDSLTAEVPLELTQRVGNKLLIADIRVQQGESVDLDITGAKLSSSTWADPTVQFTKDLTSDAELFDVVPENVKVTDASGVGVSVEVQAYSGFVTVEPVITAGPLTVDVRYKAKRTVTKVFSRTGPAPASVALSASDIINFVRRDRLVIDNLRLTTDITYSPLTNGELQYEIDGTMGKVRAQVINTSARSFIKIDQHQDSDAEFIPISPAIANETLLWIREFYDHWAVLTDLGNLYCISPVDGSIKWAYAVTPPEGYTIQGFTFGADNTLYVLGLDGSSDFQVLKYDPSYDYYLSSWELDVDQSTHRIYTMYTKYEYEDLQLNTDFAIEQYAGYRLFEEGLV